MTRSDRTLLIAAGAVFVAIIAGGLLFAPSPDDENPVPSTYSTGSGGARAAYLLLSQLGYPVSLWEEAPSMLQNPGDGAMLILAEPTDPPTKQDVEALRHFVETGGKVLFCGPSAGSYFPGAAISASRSGEGWKEFTAQFPSYVSHRAQTIVMQPNARWTDLGPSQLALYGDDASAVIVAWRFGQGEILWWAGATPLTNSGITREGNLNLFLNSVGGEPGAVNQIYWDEYFHGQRRSLWNYFETTPLKWALVQFGLFALAALLTFSRRSGPIVPAPTPSRLSPLEFIDTMGGLYQRAGAASVAAAVSYRRFRFLLSRRLALSNSVSDEELSSAAERRLGLPADAIRGALENAALYSRRQGKLSARKVLDVVRELAHFEVELSHPGRPSREPGSPSKRNQENY